MVAEEADGSDTRIRHDPAYPLPSESKLLMPFARSGRGNRLASLMPKKPNYNFEKNMREQRKAAKMEAKREEKLRRKQEAERNSQPPQNDDQQQFPE